MAGIDVERTQRMLQALLVACDPAGLLDDGAGLDAYDALVAPATALLVAARSSDDLAEAYLELFGERKGDLFRDREVDEAAVGRLAHAAYGWLVERMAA